MRKVSHDLPGNLRSSKIDIDHDLLLCFGHCAWWKIYRSVNYLTPSGFGNALILLKMHDHTRDWHNIYLLKTKRQSAQHSERISVIKSQSEASEMKQHFFSKKHSEILHLLHHQ